MRLIRLILVFVLLAGAGFYYIAYWPLRDKHPTPQPAHGTLAIVGARIYPSPDAPTIPSGTIVVRDGTIVAVGNQVDVPPGAQVIPCHGCVVTAGFWNCHVHFTERKWSGADQAEAARLQAQLDDMLNRRGFTTVVDTGSNLRDTVPLRRRIASGELAGPKIYTAGAAQYPPNGIPYYLRDTLPKWMLYLMPQPKTPGAAARIEQRNIAEGADILKLFTGSYVARGTVLPMPVENATSRRHCRPSAWPARVCP